MNLFRKVRTFFSDLRVGSPATNLWGAILNVPQILGGIYFWYRPEAVTVALVTIITLIVASEIHSRDRFSRLIGICHIFWLSLAPVVALWALDPGEAAGFRIWAAYVAITMAVSLLFDLRDVYLWRFTADRHYSFRGVGR